MHFLDQIDWAISKMKHSNVKGADEITYIHLIEAKTPIFRQILCKFYNSMLISKKIPADLNAPIIKPIVKNQNKSLEDINNIRPLSISNCLAQMLEQLILMNSPELRKIIRINLVLKLKLLVIMQSLLQKKQFSHTRKMTLHAKLLPWMQKRHLKRFSELVHKNVRKSI